MVRGLRPNQVAPSDIELANFVHVKLIELKVPHGIVCLDPTRCHTLGNAAAARLNVPTKDNLSGAFSMFAANSIDIGMIKHLVTDFGEPRGD